ncbi:MAG: Ig-like domain repeat protein, partial [Oscillospiraceae bacterium]|nr:Ig-like domain repeat protein [Oscillospiraceae bacterium]
MRIERSVRRILALLLAIVMFASQIQGISPGDAPVEVSPGDSAVSDISAPEAQGVLDVPESGEQQDTPAEPETEASAEAAAEAPAEPSAEAPAETTETPAEPSEITVELPTEQPTEQPTEEPSETPAEKPAETPAQSEPSPEQPTDKPTETPTEQPAEKPAEGVEQAEKKPEEKLVGTTNPSTIPLVSGPDAAGVEITVEEDAPVSCGLSIPSAGTYVVQIDKVAGSRFRFAVRVRDSADSDVAGTWCYGSYEDSWGAYFTADQAGEYTVNLEDAYFENYDESLEPETSCTVSVKAYATISAPSFDLDESVVDENGSYTAPFELHFTDIPADAEVWYCVYTRAWGKEEPDEFVRYDPQAPAIINDYCNVEAYAQKTTAAGTLKSESIYMDFWPDVEYPACSAAYPNNIVESGGTVTLSTEDPTVSIYYFLRPIDPNAQYDWQQEMQYRNASYIVEHGTLYTGPITVTGSTDDQIYLYSVAVTATGLKGQGDYYEITIGTPPPPVPTFSPDAEYSNGIYTPVSWEQPTTVTVTSAEGTTICYKYNKYTGSFEIGDDGVYSTPGNTLTFVADRDMYIEVRAYDPVSGLYSDVKTSGYGSGNSARGYLIAQPKTLTVTQSAEVSSSGMVFEDHNEDYTIAVQQAGTYRFRISYPDMSWSSSHPAYLYDANDQLVTEIEVDGSSWSGNLLTSDCTLAAGTYRLEICCDQGSGYYTSAGQGYELTISKGVQAPTFSPEGGEFDGPVALSLLHDDPDAEIWYRREYYDNGWHYEDYTLYTGPITISYNTTVYAYAQSGSAVSDTVNEYYRINLAPPTFSQTGSGYSRPFALTLSHANPDCEIWYRMGYSGDFTQYTEPISINSNTYVFAYSVLGSVTSNTAQQYYSIDATAPTLYDYYRFNISRNGYSGYLYGDAALAGEVQIRATNISDSDSGIDHVDYYLKVGDGAYTLLGSAPYYEYVTWDTTTVSGSASGPVQARLLCIAYDGVGFATAKVSDLTDDYDVTYAPAFAVDNTSCTALSTFTAEPGVASVSLNWSRESGLDYSDTILIYRGSTAAELATAEPIISTYYYNNPYSDVFFTEEEVSSAYYYGARVRDGRGVESDMLTVGPVRPLADTSAPAIRFEFDEGAYINGGNVYFSCLDESAVVTVSALLIAADGAEIVPERSPWTYSANTYYASVSPYVTSAEFAALSDGAYTLRVTATDAFGNQAASETHFVKDSTAPAAPVVTTSPVPGKIDLRWTASADADVVGYRVYCCETEDGSYWRANYYAGDTLTERAFTYPEYSYLTPGDVYWFKVEAIDRAGNTGTSAPVQGTAGKYNPAIRLVTESPRLGDDVEIAFSGFRSGEYVYFYLDRSDDYFDYEYSDNATEERTVTLRGSTMLRGVHTIRAVGSSSGAVAQLRVSIGDLTPTLTISPASVTEGGSFTVRLSGFPEDRAVYFLLDPTVSSTDGAPYTYYDADDDSTELYLSSFDDPSPGVYVMRAVEPVSGLTATAALTVTTPQVTLRCSEEEVYSGAYVRFYAAGLSYGDADLYVAGEKVATMSRSYSGTEHSAYASIPELSADAGAVLATVVQTATGRQASVVIPVRRTTASIELPDGSVGFESFTVRGSGFAYGEKVKLSVDGAEVGSSNYYSDVSFTHSFDYAASAGRHSVELRGETSGLSASGSVVHTVVVQTIALSDTPRLEQPLTIFASGFKSGESVAFSLNSGAVTGSGTADSSGNAQFAIDSLTYSPADGNYAITAIGASGGRVAFYGISGVPGGELTLSYSGNIRSGGSVNVAVTGLDAGETADVYVNNRIMPTVTADAAGAATVNFAVPAGFTGSLSVCVRGESSQRWGTVTISANGFDPLLAVSPAAPAAGSTLTIDVSGHMPNAVLQLSLDGRIVNDAVTTDANGAVSVPYVLPVNTVIGAHTIRVFHAASGLKQETTVNVAAAAPALTVPASAQPGETVTLGASGLASGEKVRISVNGKSIGDVLTESDGAVSTTYTLPVNAQAGEYTVAFALEQSAAVATASFTVSSSAASVQSDMAQDSAVICISAQGFLPGEALTVYFDHREINAKLSSYTADSEGNLTVSYTLDVDTVAGDHEIVVFGRQSRRSAVGTVTVREIGPVLSVPGSAEGKAGDTLEYSGANFTPDGTYALYFESELLSSDGVANEFGEVSGTFAIPTGYADGTYQLIANDTVSGKTAICYVHIDTTAPGAPTLSLSARKQSIVLSWTAPSDEDVASYTVYCRPEGEGAYTKLAELDRSVTNWTHEMRNETFPLSGSVRYEYTVTATDRLGQEGEGSPAAVEALADGNEAPSVGSAYPTTGGSIRVGSEWLSTVRGSANVFSVSASDDQQVVSVSAEAARDGGEYVPVGSAVPTFNGSYNGSANYRAEITVDTTALADGVYTFRFIARDNSGNTGTLERRYYVDNTPPAAVTDLNVTGGPNCLYLNWNWTPDAVGIDRYCVRYATDSSFSTSDYRYVYYYEGVKSCTIRGLTPETVYYVRVTAIDAAGNESAFTAGSAAPIVDNEKPVITAVTPEDRRLGEDVWFSVEATDNAELDWSTLTAEISAGENGAFVPFGSPYTGGVSAYDLTYNGTYTLRFRISDQAGNLSDYYEIVREFDTQVSLVTGLTAAPAAGGIRLTWDRVPDNDLSNYYVYRSEDGVSYSARNYLSPLKITSGNTVSWIDYNVQDGVEYFYRIVAVDDLYNRSSLEDTTSASSARGNYAAAMSLTPAADVTPGSMIHISASGFRGGESVVGYIDDQTDYIFWTYADDEGGVSTDWSYVRATGEGTHTIRLEGSYSAASAEASFTCRPAVLPAPSAPESTPGVMEIRLSWESVSGASYYRIYRSEGAAAAVLLADRVYGCSYRDTAVGISGDVGRIYTYTVAAVDRYGNEGMRSESTVNRPDPDTVDPEVSVFTFRRTGNELRLIAEASDDLRLASVIFRYKPAAAADSAYQIIAEAPVSGSVKTATINAVFDTSALADGSYTLSAQAVDGAGRVSAPVTRAMTISSEAPNAPEELTAVAGQMRVMLTWQEPTVQTVPIARYNIYRKIGAGEYGFIASTTLTSYTDTNVTMGGSYLYRVTCVSDAETEGPAVTLAAAVTPLADIVPPVIAGFLTPDGTRLAGKISLAVSVTDNVSVDHVDFFLITESGETKLGSSATGSVTVETAEYIAEGTLTFRARAYDAAGNSAEADVSYRVDNVAPAVPQLTAVPSELSVTLRWTMSAAPKDLARYRIYRYVRTDDPDNPEEYRLLGETTAQLYVYTTAAQGSYCVTAVDDLGNESGYSNIVECMPGLDSTPPVIHEFGCAEIVRTDAALTIRAEDNTAIASYRIEYRPLTTNETTGAVIPVGDTWYVLSVGTWDSLVGESAKTVEWNTLAVVASESGPEAKFPDGLYAVLLTLTDTAGNSSSVELRASVANDPPSAPEGFRVDAGEWRMIVSWKSAAGNEASAYALYRKINDGDYELLTTTTSNVYVDQGLNPVNQYFYQVAIENDLGKLGPRTADYSGDEILPAGVRTRPDPETSMPVIMAMTPSQGSRFNAGLAVSLQVNDAVSLSTVELYKAYIGESSAAAVPADAVYESFAVIDASALQKETVYTSDSDVFGTELFVVRYNADTSAWEQGAYAIKAVVRNMGAQPSEQIKTYFKDSTPPEQPKLTLSDPCVGGTVNLSWTSGGADVAYYRVLRTTDPAAGPEDCTEIAKPLSPAYTDTGLTDGTTYYYYIEVVDNAGNVSLPSVRQSIVPTAVSDLGVYAVYTTPATLVAGRSNSIRASLRNNGSAKADGVVTFYYGAIEIGSAGITLAANTGGEASVTWDAPSDLPERISITASVTTKQNTDATFDNNDFTGENLKVNQPPVAVIVLPGLSPEGNYDSGASLSFGSTGSHDPDGTIVRYRWDFGNGKKGDYATSPVAYTMPGKYNVTLTVTDDLGASTTATQTVTVGDRRPDLFVESVRWSPADPEEGDVVTITAVIGNKGLGDATLGFLTGFYIDNRYMGYVKTDVDETGVSLAEGKTVEVSFTYQATAGTHIVKVVANDILNNLAETSKSNNVKSEALSSRQLNFADVAVRNVRWDPAGSVFDTQAPFVYRADVVNLGTADAQNFSVSIYIDDEYSGRQNVPVLRAGETVTLSFAAVPTAGVHKVEVKADDLNPTLIEADVENNVGSLVTDEFSVFYPALEVTEVTWRPTETTLTDGTSLLFTAKLTNVSAVSVTESFRVSFTMDGRVFRTVTVDGIGAGEVKEVQAKWAAANGSHQLGVVVDPQHAVTDPDAVTRKDIELPRLSIIYPNVCVTNVSYSPIRAEAGKTVSFLAYITNNNVATAFKRFTVGLYVDGKAVSGATVDGIRGFSTVPVVLTWKPESGGAHTVKIVADSYGELKMDAPAEGTSRTWSSVINVGEALVITTHPNKAEQDEDFLAVLYSTSEEKITLSAELRHSSDPKHQITPEDDGAVQYILSRNDETVMSGSMRYDYAAQCFTADLPLSGDMATGTYQLDFIGTCGAESVEAAACNIKLVRNGNVTVETNKTS